jgi:hypothetical protein
VKKERNYKPEKHSQPKNILPFVGRPTPNSESMASLSLHKIDAVVCSKLYGLTDQEAVDVVVGFGIDGREIGWVEPWDAPRSVQARKFLITKFGDPIPEESEGVPVKRKKNRK